MLLDESMWRQTACTPSLFVLLHNCRCASQIECYAVIVRFVTQSMDHSLRKQLACTYKLLLWNNLNTFDQLCSLLQATRLDFRESRFGLIEPGSCACAPVVLSSLRSVCAKAKHCIDLDKTASDYVVAAMNLLASESAALAVASTYC